MKSTILWDITPCSPLKFNRRFGGKYRLYLRGRRISRARNQRERTRLATCFHVGFFLSLSSSLKMETICSSETSVVFQRTTRRYIPVDSILLKIHNSRKALGWWCTRELGIRRSALVRLCVHATSGVWRISSACLFFAYLITVMQLIRWLDYLYIAASLSDTSFAMLEKEASHCYKISRLGFEVLTAVTDDFHSLGYNAVYFGESQTFWDITPCCPVDFHQTPRLYTAEDRIFHRDLRFVYHCYHSWWPNVLCSNTDPAIMTEIFIVLT
jgi:hypothetical protein